MPPKNQRAGRFRRGGGWAARRHGDAHSGSVTGRGPLDEQAVSSVSRRRRVGGRRLGEQGYSAAASAQPMTWPAHPLLLRRPAKWSRRGGVTGGGGAFELAEAGRRLSQRQPAGEHFVGHLLLAGQPGHRPCAVRSSAASRSSPRRICSRNSGRFHQSRLISAAHDGAVLAQGGKTSCPARRGTTGCGRRDSWNSPLRFGGSAAWGGRRR